MWIWPTLALIFCQVLPDSFAQDLPGVATTSSHPSGEQCSSSSSTRCISEALCTSTDTCRCPDQSYGDGRFQCYPNSNIRAEISGEKNRLKTFSNSSASVNWPCRFRFTEFQSARASNGRKCHFQVFGVNKIVGGRIVLVGMEVHFSLPDDPEITNGIGIRKMGFANNGTFMYKEWGRNDFIQESTISDQELTRIVRSSHDESSGSGDDGLSLVDRDLDSLDFQSENLEWGQPEELDIGGGERIACKINEDNFASVDVPDCGVSIRFRAPNVDGSAADQSPGLSVSISEQRGAVRYYDPLTYLAGTAREDTLTSNVQRKGISVEQEILHLSMEYPAAQYSSPEGEECDDTAFTYNIYCETDDAKIRALSSCSFFLENSDLISCMESSKGAFINGLKAFKLCMWNSCSPNHSVCSMLKYKVAKAGCASLIPEGFDTMTCPSA